MDISKHILSYLSENSSIIVPGLGRFIAVDKPSVIIGDVVLPPIRSVEFDSSVDEDDNSLTTYIAQQENISVEQVRANTTEFYNNIKEKLAHRKTIMLNNLGTLAVGAFGDIVFTPDPALNIERVDSYGLSAVGIHGTTDSATSGSSTSVKEAPIPEVSATPAANASETTEGSLFASENTRVRENTERRQSTVERQEPPVKPVRSGAVPSSQTSKKTKTQEKKKKTSTASNGFPMWILLVLLIAGGLGVAGYYFYPKLSPYITSTISSIKGEKKAVDKNQTATVEPEKQEDTPNPEVGQTLDDATDKKNALNPAATDNTTQSEPATQTAAQPVTQPEAKPATQHTKPAVAQGSVGQGKYLLVVGSFTTQAGAEKFGKSLQEAGINYEIIDFGGGRVRVTVGSYNEKTEAYNHANKFKSKPNCENVWVLKR